MPFISSFKKDYLTAEDGATAVLATLLLPVLIGMAAVAVDTSSWFMGKRDLQTAADAAAMAAAYEYYNGDVDEIETAAMREAGNNGFDSAAGAITVDLVEDEEAGGANITVGLTQPAHLWFASIFVDSVTVGAEAESFVSSIDNGSACLLSLDPFAEQALKISGNVTVSMPNCGIAVNSEGDEALYMNGSVIVGANDVRVHGSYETVGNVTFEYSSLRTGAARVADPYADLETPEFDACTSQSKNQPVKVNSDTTLNPGVYCGGLSITGNTDITFNPGVYILDGGDFKVTGGGYAYRRRRKLCADQ